MGMGGCGLLRHRTAGGFHFLNSLIYSVNNKRSREWIMERVLCLSRVDFLFTIINVLAIPVDTVLLFLFFGGIEFPLRSLSFWSRYIVYPIYNQIITLSEFVSIEIITINK